LEAWDVALSDLLAALRPNDLLILTADHGNDPTTPSTDHSREHPFLLAFSPSLRQGVALGTRSTFADIAATVREVFGLPEGAHGVGFLADLGLE
jgi:phosphopentomutase